MSASMRAVKTAMAFSPALFSVFQGAAGLSPIDIVLPLEWAALKTQVEGRLYPGTPFASPCFPVVDGVHHPVNASACANVQAHLLDEVALTSVFGGQIQPQWDSCQSTGAQCMLDWSNPNNTKPMSYPYTCSSGSVSEYYIDVRKPEDVTHAFSFSKLTQVPLIIKNTGHDYKGRSSAPSSLGLWTHNLNSITYNAAFVADGCKVANSAMTLGSGVQWKDAYAFAEANNVTIMGGSDETVGAAGGWLQGGGQGALANTLGMGADRVLQFKVVTPDGVYRTANACQNTDLFFALRGGGGGTFGVVLEATTLVAPRLTLQATVISWANPNTTLTKQMWTILLDNALTWADQGYGGYIWGETIIYVTPLLNSTEAAKTMAPISAFGQGLIAANVTGATLLQLEFPSWFTFFETFAHAKAALTGVPLAMASRLIPRNNLQTPAERATLLSAMLATFATTPLMDILMAPPSSYPGDGTTSMTDAWRNSIYHITVVSPLNYNSTLAEKKATYSLVSTSINHLRAITPDAAYSNEADVHEPNHEVSFWGTHYSKLQEIKKKYDPSHLLDCWHCVGWNPLSPRFSCYV